MFFKFELADAVIIKRAELKGEIVGRTEYLSDQSRYLLQFNDKQGNPKEQWFAEDELMRIQ